VEVASSQASHQPPSYEELLAEFKVALNRALSGSVLLPGTALPDGPLTLALLDIAYAARDGQPTNYLVSRACFQFAQVAATGEPKVPPTTRRHLRAVR
jgi:hypothetical protein